MERRFMAFMINCRLPVYLPKEKRPALFSRGRSVDRCTFPPYPSSHQTKWLDGAAKVGWFRRARTLSEDDDGVAVFFILSKIYRVETFVSSGLRPRPRLGAAYALVPSSFY
jgi:hypothetical protein